MCLVVLAICLAIGLPFRELIRMEIGLVGMVIGMAIGLALPITGITRYY